MSELILNVDDNEAARYGTSRILRRAGHEVIEAATAEEAAHLARERKPQLVILDVNLPDRNGLELCRELKNDPRLASMLILQTSATYTTNDAKIEGLDAGADGYLVQPVEPAVLLATVRSLLRISRAEAALRASSAKLSAVLEGITDSFISLDRELRVLDINERAASTIFMADRSELIGRPLGDEPGPASQILNDELRKADGHQEPAHFETSMPSGRWLEVHAYPSADGLAVYLRDITDRKLAAEEREDLLEREHAARQEAEAASRAKDDFLATVSHELRSPINAMLLWIQLLASGTLDANGVARAVASIERSARLQARLIDDLLDTSRIIAGKLTVERVDLSLDAAIEAAVEAMRSAANAKEIGIVCELGRQPVVVSGDAGRLQQVFTNLLSNAIKFSPAGGTVKISLRSERDTAEVRVVDWGQGIEPAFLPHVFEAFRQADSSPTRSAGGLGLGLAIVHSLVAGHGGDVSAHSLGEGFGATFTVRLPRRDGAEVPPDAVAEHDRSRPLSACHILLVDDDAEFRTALTALLKGWGAHVTSAASAAEAFALFEKRRPDLLLSDIGMPQEDGFTLIRRIRALPEERGGNVKAAALTSYAIPHERSTVLDAGYHIVLNKPIEAERLRTSLLRLRSLPG